MRAHVIAGGELSTAYVTFVRALARVRAHVALEVAASAEGARTGDAREGVFKDAQVDNVDMIVKNVGVLEGLGTVSALIGPHTHVSAHVLGDRLLVVESALAKVTFKLLGEVDDAVAGQCFDTAHVLTANLAYERASGALASYVARQEFA